MFFSFLAQIELFGFVQESCPKVRESKQRHRGASTPGLLVADSIADFLSPASSVGFDFDVTY